METENDSVDAAPVGLEEPGSASNETNERANEKALETVPATNLGETIAAFEGDVLRDMVS